jgi:hypothetical protein
MNQQHAKKTTTSHPKSPADLQAEGELRRDLERLEGRPLSEQGRSGSCAEKRDLAGLEGDDIWTLTPAQVRARRRAA